MKALRKGCFCLLQPKKNNYCFICIVCDIMILEVNMKVLDKSLVRTNLNLPKHLRDRVNEYAYETGLNVTSAVIVLLKIGLDNYDVINAMKASKDSSKDGSKNSKKVG